MHLNANLYEQQLAQCTNNYREIFRYLNFIYYKSFIFTHAKLTFVQQINNSATTFINIVQKPV